MRTLIIGASDGIGRALARRLVKSGGSVALASRESDRLTALADELDSPAFVCDARRFEDLERVVKEAKEALGGLDAAVSCVGSIIVSPAQRIDQATFEELMATNVTSAFGLIRAAVPALGRGGSVALVSSCAATIGLPAHEAIGAAKAAVEGLVRSAAASNARKGIRVNAVAPGLVETKLASRFLGNDRLRKASEQRHPLGRVGRPEDVAGALAFLIDPDNSWITGQVLGVDGGLASLKPV